MEFSSHCSSQSWAALWAWLSILLVKQRIGLSCNSFIVSYDKWRDIVCGMLTLFERVMKIILSWPAPNVDAFVFSSVCSFYDEVDLPNILDVLLQDG